MVSGNDQEGRPSLQADWSARSVWEGNRVAFFDNSIIDADAPSYSPLNISWADLGNKAASQKWRKYQLIVKQL